MNDLVRVLRDEEVAVPTGARARVWSRLEARRAARRRLALPLAFAAAAAMALVATEVKRHRSEATSPSVAIAELVSVAPGSAATVRGDVVVLERGELIARRPAKVRAGRALVRVDGMAWVRAAGDEIEVAVASGSAEIVSDVGMETPVLLGAGARWPQAQASGPDALRRESELFDEGWRALHERSDAHAALAIWERQRTEFPDGALRTEADASIIEALAQLGDTARAGREIDGFLARHPGDVAAPQLHWLKATLARSAGDCATAVVEIDRALQHPDPAWAEAARRARAACAR